MWAEGGLYTDIDTQCLKPIDEWPRQDWLSDPTVELVTGLEVDGFFGSNRRAQYGFVNEMQMVQWSIWSKKHSAVLRQAIVLAFGRYLRLAESEGVPELSIQGLQTTEMSNTDILMTTGPGSFSDAVESHIKAGLGQADWSFATAVHNLTAPARFGDVVILPITAWSPNAPHSGAKPETDPDALLKHVWSHSWHGQDTYRWKEDWLADEAEDATWEPAVDEDEAVL